jgi:hypothetical protein
VFLKKATLREFAMFFSSFCTLCDGDAAHLIRQSIQHLQDPSFAPLHLDLVLGVWVLGVFFASHGSNIGHTKSFLTLDGYLDSLLQMTENAAISAVVIPLLVDHLPLDMLVCGEDGGAWTQLQRWKHHLEGRSLDRLLQVNILRQTLALQQLKMCSPLIP